MEGVVLNRVCILGIFCSKQDQRFKPSATHLYPNIGQVSTQGFPVLVTTVIAGNRPRYCLNFLKRKQPFRPEGGGGLGV